MEQVDQHRSELFRWGRALEKALAKREAPSQTRRSASPSAREPVHMQQAIWCHCEGILFAVGDDDVDALAWWWKSVRLQRLSRGNALELGWHQLLLQLRRYVALQAMSARVFFCMAWALICRRWTMVESKKSSATSLEAKARLLAAHCSLVMRAQKGLRQRVLDVMRVASMHAQRSCFAMMPCSLAPLKAHLCGGPCSEIARPLAPCCGHELGEAAMGARMTDGLARYDDPLDAPVVKDLQALDDEYAIVKQEHQEEHAELMRKYEGLFRKVLDRRSSLLAEVKASSRPPRSRMVAGPAIPAFWRIALQNAVEFGEDIEHHDEPVLDFLRDMRCEWIDDSHLDKGFRIRFFFSPNPYFSNSVLEKAYHTEPKNKYCAEHSTNCVKIEATTINWQPGRNVTVELGPKTGAKRQTGNKKKRTETPRPSFFRSFFRSLGPDADIPEEELEDDEDEDEFVDRLLYDDYYLGLVLRERLIPHAVRCYLGEAEDSSSSSTCSSGSEDSSASDDDDEDEDSTVARKSRRVNGRGAQAGRKPSKTKTSLHIVHKAHKPR